MIQDPHSLLPIAYRAAAQVLRNRHLAEEAGERALHLLTLAMIQGEPPEHPKAWLRSVARRSACALLNSPWGRTKLVDTITLQDQAAPEDGPPAPACDWLRDSLAAELSPRQQAALRAAVSCNGTRAAARCCGMQPRDFRRSLHSISRKARQLLARQPDQDALAGPCGASFPLDR